MSEEKTTLENLHYVTAGLVCIAEKMEELHKNIRRDEAEITKLNSIIDELRDENERLKQAAKGGEA